MCNTSLEPKFKCFKSALVLSTSTFPLLLLLPLLLPLPLPLPLPLLPLPLRHARSAHRGRLEAHPWPHGRRHRIAELLHTLQGDIHDDLDAAKGLHARHVAALSL